MQQLEHAGESLMLARLPARRFDQRIAAPFIEKSVSEETMIAYRTAVPRVFPFVTGIHPDARGAGARESQFQL